MERVKFTADLSGVKAFQNLSEPGRLLLTRGLRHIQHSKITPVLQKGQRVSGAYVVVSGQLRVYTLSPEGNEATLYSINPGEACVLAMNCVFNDLLYPAWVETSPAAKIAIIPGAVFRVLFESEPAIRNMTVQAFSTIVFRLMAGLEEIHSYKLEHRLANFFLLQASTSGMIRMTQQEIASHLGTTREVIARLLGQFVADGHIRSSRNQIVINDPALLADFVRRGKLSSKLKHQRSMTHLPAASPPRRRGGT